MVTREHEWNREVSAEQSEESLPKRELHVRASSTNPQSVRHNYASCGHDNCRESLSWHDNLLDSDNRLHAKPVMMAVINVYSPSDKQFL